MRSILAAGRCPAPTSSCDEPGSRLTQSGARGERARGDEVQRRAHAALPVPVGATKPCAGGREKALAEYRADPHFGCGLDANRVMPVGCAFQASRERELSPLGGDRRNALEDL